MPETDPTFAESQKQALVRDGYDAIAGPYTGLAANVDSSHPRRERTSALLSRLQPGSSVLELGCGGGVPVAAAVVAAGHEFLGVDVSPMQINLAVRNVPDGRFLVGDLAEQEFEPAAFNAVLMLYVITHVPREKWRAVFRAVHRWLSPCGWLLLNVPHHESAGWLEENFLGLGTTNWTNGFDASTTHGLLADEDFTVVDAQRLGEDDLDPEGWLWILARRAS